MNDIRWVRVESGNREEVAKYLPGNFIVVGPGATDDVTMVMGRDRAGWTVEGYVIPRLGSGMIYAEEYFPPACFKPTKELLDRLTQH